MKRVILLMLLMFMPLSAYADFDPEVTYLLGLMHTLEATYLPQLASIYSTINGLQSDMKGYLSGSFKFDIKDQELQQYKWEGDDSSWTSVLSASGGGEEFRKAKDNYDHLYPTDTPDKLKNISDSSKNQYDQSRQINSAALAASATSYTLISQHMQNVKDLLARLNNETSEKVTADLNARLLAELCFIQLETLKQQNFQTQLVATSSQANVNSTSDTADFFKWEAK